MGIRINKKKSNEIIVLLCGIVSTFQLLNVGSYTAFTVFVVLLAILFFAEGKIKFTGKLIKYLILFTTISEICTFSIDLSNSTEWQRRSFKSYILRLLIYFVFCFICLSEDYIKKFIEGFNISCVIQLLWCYLQLIGRVTNIDINQKVFSNLVDNGSFSYVSAYKNGKLALTGLTVNSGVLFPIFLFLLIFNKNKIIHILTLIVMVLSGGSTLPACAILYLLTKIIITIKQLSKSGKINSKRLAFDLLVIIGIIFFMIFELRAESTTSLMKVFKTLNDRFSSVLNNGFYDSSTVIHARYLTSIPYVLTHINPLNILFGFGLGCSGVPFVKFYGQYPDMIWVPECDPVAFLYDTGIIGIALFYYLLLYIAIKGHKIDNKYSLYMFLVIIVGFFYNGQLNYIVLLEFVMYWLVCNKQMMPEYNIFRNMDEKVKEKHYIGLRHIQEERA